MSMRFAVVPVVAGLAVLGIITYGVLTIPNPDAGTPPALMQPNIWAGNELRIDARPYHDRPPSADTTIGQAWENVKYVMRAWRDPCVHHPPLVRLLDIPGVQGVQLPHWEADAPIIIVRKHPEASFDDIEPQVMALLRLRGCD